MSGSAQLYFLSERMDLSPVSSGCVLLSASCKEVTKGKKKGAADDSV